MRDGGLVNSQRGHWLTAPLVLRSASSATRPPQLASLFSAMFGIAAIPGLDMYEWLLALLEYTPHLLALSIVAFFLVKKSYRWYIAAILPITYLGIIGGAWAGSHEDARRRGYNMSMPSVRGALEQYIETGECAHLLPGVKSASCAIEILEAPLQFAPTFGAYELTYMFKDLVTHSVLHLDSHNVGNIKEGYNKGDHWFENTLGKDAMVYTSGIYKHGNETLVEAQKYKLDYVAQAIELKKGDRVLDIGCGWGRLIQHFTDYYGAEVTGITLSSGQKAWAEKNLGVNTPGKGTVMLQDGMKMYDDHHGNTAVVPAGGFDKITSLEMAEHVGIRRYHEFLTKVHELLADDGVFYFQVAGLRRHWRYEDLIWGMFMGEHVFPGADASCSIGWVSTHLERAGFEIQRVSNLGSHYSRTLDQWLENWRAAKTKTIELFGAQAFRRWEVFLVWSVRVARQGSSTVFMFTVTKAGGKKNISPEVSAIREARRVQSQRNLVPTWEKNQVNVDWKPKMYYLGGAEVGAVKK